MSHIYEQLTLRRESPALWRVTFNNPPINLVNPDTLVELDVLVTELEASEEVKVVVFDSADADFFLAHWDVSPTAQKTRSGAPAPPWMETALRLSKTPVVSIASIRGRARGMGSEFALACDLRFASRERAVFGQPEVGVGLVPGGGAMERLPLLVGRPRALEIVLGAGDFDADTAERYGWINRALPDAALDDFVDALARRIASFDKQALAMAKRILNRNALPDPEHLKESQVAFFGAFAWPETQARAKQAFALGIGTRGDFEMRFGERLSELAPE
ncbi:MAG TPA: enoyl-CoA hydratase/isomerase family protein [Lysobacter sp.]|nr:enoyl-CoA hydratase/isomerase family protein [Lysobacter sp.]